MRGQLFSFDFIFAVSLIVFIFAMALYTSESVANSINSQEIQREIKIGAENAMAQLLETPGSPTNWNYLEFSEANVKSVGIADERNALNREKTEYIVSMANSDFNNYRLLKRMLALDLPASNFSLTIYNQSRYKLFETHVQPSESALIVSIQRISLLEGRPVTVNLRVWVEK